MWIRAFKLERNIHIPYYIEEIIKQKIRMLANDLKCTLDNKYRIHLETSVISEACYLTIEDLTTGKKHCISFRNHDYFTQAPYDKTIALYRYRTWENCRIDFLEKDLPGILNKLSKGLNIY